MRAGFAETLDFHRLTLIGSGLLIALTGAGVMWGWYLHAEPIIRIIPGAPPMRFNTALAFTCVGAGLVALGGEARLRLARWPLAVAVLLGAAALLEYLTSADLGVDELFVRDPFVSGRERPGLMAPATAITFILLGIAGAALYGSRPWVSLGATLAIVVTAQAVGVLLFFALGTEAPRRPQVYTGMALHTAMLAALSGAAVLLGRPLDIGRGGEQWLPAGVAIGSLALTLVLWWGLRAQEEITFQRFIQLQAASIEREIRREIWHEARSIAGQRRRWGPPGATSSLAWQIDAEEYRRSWPGLDRIEWIDPDGRIGWVIPTTEASSLVGRSLSADSTYRAAREQAATTGAVVAGRAFTFADGSPGYFLLSPLGSAGGSEGYLRMLWRASDVLEPIVRRRLDIGYTVTIKDHDRIVYDDGAQPAPESPVIERPVNPYGLQWVLSVAATPRAFTELRSRLPVPTLIVGALFSTLMSGAVYLFLVARRRRMEIVAAERRFQLIVEGVKDYAIYMLDPAGRVVTWNAGAERTKGWRAEEVIGRPFSRFFLPEDVKEGRPERLLAAAAASGQVTEEWWHRRKDGSRFWASILLTALRDDRGQLIGFSKITRDLTERRIHEAALESTLAFQSAILQSANLSIIATDTEGMIRSINPAGERMLGYEASELIGCATPQIFTDAEEVQRRAAELSVELGRRIEPGFGTFVAKASAGLVDEREWTYVRKDGSRWPAMVSVSALRGSDGVITGYLGIASDITERKRDEDRIRAALREKEVLLKEVYHRVKNNLQVIQSLLSLQRRTLPEGLARSVIEDAGQRVRAMALVHEKLYQSANLMAVSLPDYVRDLCKQLAAATRISGRSITVSVEVAPVEVGLDTAVPLGLLLTELVSNSFKHGFPAGRSGEVQVRLVQQDKGAVLTVADDGIGLPPGVDPLHTSSLGLKLASGLAQQLGGQLEVVPAAGARFRVEIPHL